jgi:hypothetical protein
MTRSLTFLSLVLLLTVVEKLPGQGFVAEGGVNAGTIPRALEPLCGSVRRLRGVGLTARGGFAGDVFRGGATLDHVARIGVRDAADCVAHFGRSVDSSFASATNSATSLSIAGSGSFKGVFLGAEAGWVLGHSSWFVGPTLGAQLSRFRLEGTIRRHVTSFDEITRDYATQSVREISRTSRSERSWGGVARLMVIVF